MLTICRKILYMSYLLQPCLNHLFYQEFYKQYDGVAMGSPLESTLANVFLFYHGKNSLQNCSSEFKPVI